MSEFSFEALSQKWQSPIVARSEVSRFSGGLLNARTLANLDSIGEGPPRGKMGRKVYYPAEDLVAWMVARAEATR